MPGILNLLLAGAQALIALGADKTVTSIGGGTVGSASVTLSNAGAWSGSVGLEGGTGTFSSTWLTPQAFEDQYEVFATLNSGSLTSGTTGSWLNLGTSRTWGKVGAASVSLTLDIRRVGTTTVLDSVDVTLTGS